MRCYLTCCPANTSCLFACADYENVLTSHKMVGWLGGSSVASNPSYLPLGVSKSYPNILNHEHLNLSDSVVDISL